MTSISNVTRHNDISYANPKIPNQSIHRAEEAKRVQEHVREAVVRDKVRLEKYYDKLNDLKIYNRHRQMVTMQTRAGQLLDVEVK